MAKAEKETAWAPNNYGGTIWLYRLSPDVLGLRKRRKKPLTANVIRIFVHMQLKLNPNLHTGPVNRLNHLKLSPK